MFLYFPIHQLKYLFWSPMDKFKVIKAVFTVVVDSLLIVTPIVRFCNCSLFCYALLCIHSSCAIISKGSGSCLVFFVCLPCIL